MSTPVTGSIPLSTNIPLPDEGPDALRSTHSTGDLAAETHPLTTPFKLGYNAVTALTQSVRTRPLTLPGIQTDQRVIAFAISSFLMFSILGGSIIRNALGWWGWGVWVAVALTLTTIWFVQSIRLQEQFNLRSLLVDLPLPLALFLSIAVGSVLWSQYRLESAAGVGILLVTVFCGFALAALLSWRQITKVLDYVTRAILAGSLLFEFFAATMIGHPVPPAWADAQTLQTLQPQNWWTEANLFEGGRIHGLVGNATDLSLIAGISLIVLSVRITDHNIRYITGLPWMAVAGLTLALARSTTIILALTIAAAVAAAVFIRRWLPHRDEIRLFWLGIIATASAAFGTLLVLGAEFLGLFGKKTTLTGRMDLWQGVLALIRQKPLLGHGWLGYWPPWIDRFAEITEYWPMQQVHAHNAWLDVWLQLGLFGVILFALLWFSSLRHSWLRAADALKLSIRSNSLSLLPLLLFTLLLVLTLAESMILIEGTLLLFVVLVVKVHQLGKARTYPVAPA